MVHSVLLVDDNAAIRKGLRGLFDAIGFVCSESQNGEQAVSQAEQFKPDLIVLDYSMPIMSGLEAASLLRKLLPLTPILMFTMFANELFAKEALAAGVTAVFSKDQPATHLIRKAQSLVKFTAT